MVEIALRLLQHGLGLPVGRILVQRQVAVAKQSIERRGLLLGGELRLQLRGDGRRHGIVEIRLRGAGAADQLLLAVDILPLQGNILLGEIDQLVERREIALHVVEVGPRALQLALRLRERQPIGRRIDHVQHSADRDVLAFLDGDRGDLAGNVGRHQHLLGAHIGIVGRHDPAAGQIEEKPDHQSRERNDDQEDEPRSRPQALTERGLALADRPIAVAAEFQDRVRHELFPRFLPRSLQRPLGRTCERSPRAGSPWPHRDFRASAARSRDRCRQAPSP